jgi:hypothetical protein
LAKRGVVAMILNLSAGKPRYGVLAAAGVEAAGVEAAAGVDGAGAAAAAAGFSVSYTPTTLAVILASLTA